VQVNLTSTEARIALLCLAAIIAALIAGGVLWALLVAAFCVLGAVVFYRVRTGTTPRYVAWALGALGVACLPLVGKDIVGMSP
jgi:hypothetical protein